MFVTFLSCCTYFLQRSFREHKLYKLNKERE